MATKLARYRVVAVSLAPEAISAADRLATTLSDEGWPNATRSFIIREALERLREDLLGLNEEQIFFYFLKRRARKTAPRPIAVASQH